MKPNLTFGVLMFVLVAATTIKMAGQQGPGGRGNGGSDGSESSKIQIGFNIAPCRSIWKARTRRSSALEATS